MEFKLRQQISALLLLFLGAAILFSSCKDEPTNTTLSTPAKARIKIPKFNQDTAFAFIEKQLSFGYRIPGTPESIACKDWMVAKLESYGAEVIEQKFKASFMDRKDVPSTNVIAIFNPDHKNRVLLCAHWDTRLIAEKDPDESKREQPILGADDGASGVAALLEIARVIKNSPIDLGIDLVFFDAEDNGKDDERSWCLGSQYWSQNPHKKNYKAEFGILLDMVGAKGAQFTKEGWSQYYAKDIHDKIWKLAQAMGNGDRFYNESTGRITDDHKYVNEYLGIPTIDIINRQYPNKNGHGFGDYHHTHDDNIDVIDKRTLKVVGQVVTAVIYKTSEGSLQ